MNQNGNNTWEVPLASSGAYYFANYGSTYIQESQTIELQWNVHCPNGLLYGLRTLGPNQCFGSGPLSHVTPGGTYNIEAFLVREYGGVTIVADPGILIILTVCHPSGAGYWVSRNRVAFNTVQEFHPCCSHPDLVGRFVEMRSGYVPPFVFIKERFFQPQNGEQLEVMVLNSIDCGLCDYYASRGVYEKFTLNFSIEIPAQPIPSTYGFLFSGYFYDVTFLVGNSRYPAHKSILSAASPVFRTMFTGLTYENITGFVNLSTFQPSDVLGLLEFIYMKTVMDFSSKALALLILSYHFQMPDLKLMCEECLMTKITVENAKRMYNIGKFVASQSIVDKCVIMFNTHRELIWRTKEEFTNDCLQFSELLFDVSRVSMQPQRFL